MSNWNRRDYLFCAWGIVGASELKLASRIASGLPLLSDTHLSRNLPHLCSNDLRLVLYKQMCALICTRYKHIAALFRVLFQLAPNEPGACRLPPLLFLAIKWGTKMNLNIRLFTYSGKSHLNYQHINNGLPKIDHPYTAFCFWWC